METRVVFDVRVHVARGGTVRLIPGEIRVLQWVRRTRLGR